MPENLDAERLHGVTSMGGALSAKAEAQKTAGASLEHTAERLGEAHEKETCGHIASNLDSLYTMVAVTRNWKKELRDKLKEPASVRDIHVQGECLFSLCYASESDPRRLPLSMWYLNRSGILEQVSVNLDALNSSLPEKRRNWDAELAIADQLDLCPPPRMESEVANEQCLK
ncbi:hypothetical protein F503_08811 [Ophiostoma piceae UAMH 11346]|uniref:Uncharacterized protein n=1 Tax=Ophiostoma piceae (strain UAMH 11346) TaxID=1262450 RepID=S3BNW7_OPHP1|nr:hypothetical protein F503_08811 [Ophiostoma piceae UAMH 11346]